MHGEYKGIIIISHASLVPVTSPTITFFWGFFIHAITILQVQRYAITIRIFGDLPLQFHVSLVHAILLHLYRIWTHY